MSGGKEQQKNRSDSVKNSRFHVLPPEPSRAPYPGFVALAFMLALLGFSCFCFLPLGVGASALTLRDPVLLASAHPNSFSEVKAAPAPKPNLFQLAKRQRRETY